MENNIESYTERFQAAFKSTIRKLGPELSSHMNVGLTGPQFFMLHFIQREKQCKTTKLAEKMEVKPSAITVMIDRLVNNGFVTREHDEQDRRVVLVQLTETGHKALDEVSQLRKKIIGRYLSHLEPEVLETFVQAFEKLAAISLPVEAEE